MRKIGLVAVGSATIAHRQWSLIRTHSEKRLLFLRIAENLVDYVRLVATQLPLKMRKIVLVAVGSATIAHRQWSLIRTHSEKRLLFLRIAEGLVDYVRPTPSSRRPSPTTLGRYVAP